MPCAPRALVIFAILAVVPDGARLALKTDTERHQHGLFNALDGPEILLIL